MTPKQMNQVLTGVTQRIAIKDIVDDLMRTRRLPVTVDKRLLPTKVVPQQELVIENVSPYGMIELNKYNEGVR